MGFLSHIPFHSSLPALYSSVKSIKFPELLISKYCTLSESTFRQELSWGVGLPTLAKSVHIRSMLELTWNQNPIVQLQKFCVLLSYPLVSLSAHHGDGHLVSLEQHEQLVCVAHTIIGP